MAKSWKKSILIATVLLIIIVPVLWFVFTPDTTPAGLQIEESIDMSYSEWNIGANYQWTKVVEEANGEILVRDSNDDMIAKATRYFNSIDIGKIKFDIRALSTSREYFAMEFRSGDSMLFMLERKSITLTFVVLNNMAIILYDMDLSWRTIEISFDLSDSGNSNVSVIVDDVIAIGEFPFDANGKLIDNIYMHTSISTYRSQTGVKFDYLYNLE